MYRKRQDTKKQHPSYYLEMWRISWRETKQQLGLWPQITSLILIVVVLFINIYQVKGLKETLETIWSGYWPNIIGIFILLLFMPTWAFVKLFWVIPREYRKTQNEIKNLEKRLKSEIINANISLYPFSLDADKAYALLKVRNNEKSKGITGCRAKITSFFMSCNDEGKMLDFTSSITAIEYPFFYWQDNHAKQIDIEHSDEKILCVAVAKDNKFLHLSELKDEYDFPAIASKDGKRFYEIKFKMELSGIVGNKNQVFYKDFSGRVFFSSTTIKEADKVVLVDRIEFDEIDEEDLVETF